MKKFKLEICVLLLVLITGSVFAYQRMKRWSGPTVMSNGTTALVSGVTGKRIVLKNIMTTVANAGYLYFYSDGTALSDTAISNKFYFGANSGVSSLDWDNLDFQTLAGEGLGVWTSADLGSDIIFEYETIDD